MFSVNFCPKILFFLKIVWLNTVEPYVQDMAYNAADKSLARPGRKQATATEDFELHTGWAKSRYAL
jgi:hypothetical protein